MEKTTLATQSPQSDYNISLTITGLKFSFFDDIQIEPLNA